MKKKQINLITLGCAKNIVDSEFLAKQLEANNFVVSHESGDLNDMVIINTCGFINDAKQESINMIMDYISAKKEGRINKLFVMGCLSERYKQELEQEIPEVDGFFGVDQQQEILNSLKGGLLDVFLHERKLYTPNHYAYLKIAEGCNRTCAFCSIPLIRGTYRSKTIEALKKEAYFLNKKEVRELNIIAQDLSFYGYDIYGYYALPKLIKEVAANYSFDWIRLLYLYPSNFPEEVLEVMKDYDNVCKYLDIPFQHINEKVLKNMRRGINKKRTYDLIELIKKKIPDITLRTTLLVGHPGEGDDEFKELLDFVKDVEFDRLGVFTYSIEEGTYSAQSFEDEIPDHIKKERADEIMKLQQQISLKKNQEKVGEKLNILLDREDIDNYYGRTESDAPDVDNEVIIPKNGQKFDIGSFQKAQIVSAYEYDLVGKILP
jgi:ribosomal protein S12 methylthiotransferase